MYPKSKVWFLILLGVVALLIPIFLQMPEEGVYSPAIQRWVVVGGITVIVLINSQEFRKKIRYWQIWHTGTNFIWYDVVLLFLAFTLWNTSENRVIQSFVGDKPICALFIWLEYVLFYLFLTLGVLSLGFILWNVVTQKTEKQRNLEEIKVQTSPLELISQPHVFATWLLQIYWSDYLAKADPPAADSRKPVLFKWDTLPESKTILLEIGWKRKTKIDSQQDESKKDESKSLWIVYSIEINFEGQVRKMSRREVQGLRFQ